MKIKKTMKYEVNFLPNKRCKKIRSVIREKEVEFEIHEPKAEEFPVAFVVHKHGSIYPEAKTFKDFENNRDKSEYKLYTEEIRCFEEQLYSPIRVTYGAGISTLYEKNDKMAVILSTINYGNYLTQNDDLFSEKAIIESTTEDAAFDVMNEDSKRYKYFDNKFWKRCGEPYYDVSSGGCLFVEDWYLGKESKILERYQFNAFERDKALENVSNNFSKECNIEVLIPEMVKLYHSKIFNVTICCQAYYNGQIELPKDFTGTYDDALAYAKEHLNEIPLGTLEYIPNSNELDVENCSFE